MKLEEAIAILSNAAYQHSMTTGQEFYDACKLGIEALKRHQWVRTRGYKNLSDPLPGETKE